MTDLFQHPDEYEAMLQQGIRLSGEDRLYFVRGRIADLTRQLPTGTRPHRILDFGCGIGDASRMLADAFPGADVVGVDTSAQAVAWAREHHGNPRIAFGDIASLADRDAFDLCYLNGVLHHVPPASRDAAVTVIRDALRPGGLAAVFENNPWNPGARMVMRRIPFDREAIALSPRETWALFERNAFRCRASRSLFWFPRVLAALRPLETLLAPVPLGAQYWVLAEKR